MKIQIPAAFVAVPRTGKAPVLVTTVQAHGNVVDRLRRLSRTFLRRHEEQQLAEARAVLMVAIATASSKQAWRPEHRVSMG